MKKEKYLYKYLVFFIKISNIIILRFKRKYIKEKEPNKKISSEFRLYMISLLR